MTVQVLEQRKDLKGLAGESQMPVGSDTYAPPPQCF